MSMTTTTTTTGSTRTRRTLRSLGLLLAATAVATTASISVGLGPSPAEADPGDTFLAIGSSQLLQSEDLKAIQIRLDTEKVTLNRNTAFSSCIGEGSRWTEVLPGSPKPFTAEWTSRRHQDRALYESIAQAATSAQAQQYVQTLVKAGIRDCQGKPAKYDFHYGPTTSSGVGAGSATWAVSYRGSSTRPDGGVVVFTKGTSVGFIQVSGTWGPADQMMESVAKEAVSRLR